MGWIAIALFLGLCELAHEVRKGLVQIAKAIKGQGLDY